MNGGVQIVVEVAQVFKDGGLGVRLRQLVVDVRKLNALGKKGGKANIERRCINAAETP